VFQQVMNEGCCIRMVFYSKARCACNGPVPGKRCNVAVGRCVNTQHDNRHCGMSMRLVMEAVARLAKDWANCCEMHAAGNPARLAPVTHDLLDC
jgi:hypothetical protein